MKGQKQERVSIFSREKHQASPCTKPCVSPAPNYSHLGMTKIHASVLAMVANNPMRLSVEAGAGLFIYSPWAAASATIPHIISITKGPE